MADCVDPPNKGVHWSDQEVEEFLKIWSEADVRRELDECVRNKQVFQRIAARMANKGFQRDWNQCRIKMKNMKREYKMAMKQPPSYQSAMFRGRKFFDELSKLILGSQIPSLASTSAGSPNPSELAMLGLIKREEETEEQREDEDDDSGAVVILNPSPSFPSHQHRSCSSPQLPIIASTCSMVASSPLTTTSSSSSMIVVPNVATKTTTNRNNNSNNINHQINDDEGRNSELEERITLLSSATSSSASINNSSSTTEPLPTTSSPPAVDASQSPMADDQPPNSMETTLAGALGKLADALVRVAETHAQLQRESDRMERRRENRLRRRHEEHVRAQEREHQLKMVRLILASLAASVTRPGY